MRRLTRKTVIQRLRGISRKCEQFKADISDEREAVIARCPHDWRYYGDPSGGSDSGYCCEICQTWVKHKPEAKP